MTQGSESVILSEAKNLVSHSHRLPPVIPTGPTLSFPQFLAGIQGKGTAPLVMLTRVFPPHPSPLPPGEREEGDPLFLPFPHALNVIPAVLPHPAIPARSPLSFSPALPLPFPPAPLCHSRPPPTLSFPQFLAGIQGKDTGMTGLQRSHPVNNSGLT